MTATSNPGKCKIYPENIPDELKQLSQWVGWAYEERDGKLTKIPKNPMTGGNALANDPRTWGSFEQALRALDKFSFAGIGFEFSKNDPYAGIDLDHSVDRETGQLQTWAHGHAKGLSSYCELSPSGSGVHIIVKGKLPPGGRKKGNFECYDEGRFFTFTGNSLNGNRSIEDRQAALDEFHRLVFSQESKQESKPAKTVPVSESDADLISRAKNAANGARFSQLWAGDWQGFPSQSEADQALCNHLAFWTGNDAGRIDALFRQSGLYREKWDRSDYRGATIGKAISQTTETYSASRRIENATNVAAHTTHQEHSEIQENQEKPSWTPSFPFTDFGNAERFAAQHKEKVRFCHSWGKWLVWSGRHWEIDETGAIRQLAKETARKMYADAAKMDEDDLRKRLVKHARECESAAKITSFLTLAQTEPGIATRSSDFDNDTWLLTVLNGTLDLRTGKLSPHRRGDLITKLAPVEYCDGAVCPLWLTFLDRVMGGSEELIEYLQKLTGYSLTGDTREKCLPVLHGIGDNGKTIFTATIGGMLGDYAQETPVDSLMIKRGEAIPNDIARLKGARLVTASEGERGQRLAESLIKRLTGGDKISARFLHQEWFEFTPEFKIWLSTNHKPVIRGSDNAIWNRIHLIPFEVIIPKTEQIPRTVFLERLRGEWPGILRWAVEGCLLWQKEGLIKPAEVDQATDDYRCEMDILGGFMTDCCVLNPLARVKTISIYEAYARWCGESREEPIRKSTFVSILQERGFKAARIGHKGERGWLGIGLLSEKHADTLTPADAVLPFFSESKITKEKNLKSASAGVSVSAVQTCSSCESFTPSTINPNGFGVCSGDPPDAKLAKLPTDGCDCNNHQVKEQLK